MDDQVIFSVCRAMLIANAIAWVILSNWLLPVAVRDGWLIRYTVITAISGVGGAALLLLTRP